MKPRLFIGSSGKAIEVARAIQENLDRDFEVTIWDQDIFKLSSATLYDLLDLLERIDFGVFVFHPDDSAVIKDKDQNIVRDNVLFELGLFMGKLGRKRVFFVLPDDAKDLHLPTDLSGITYGTYSSERTDQNLMAALGPFCNKVRKEGRNFSEAPALQEESEDTKQLREENYKLSLKTQELDKLIDKQLNDNKIQIEKIIREYEQAMLGQFQMHGMNNLQNIVIDVLNWGTGTYRILKYYKEFHNQLIYFDLDKNMLISHQEMVALLNGVNYLYITDPLIVDEAVSKLQNYIDNYTAIG